MSPAKILHQIYFKTTGYSFTNLGRLFLRMFVGLMLAQFGVRQLMHLDGMSGFPVLPYVEGGLAVWLIITVELLCSLFIMIGLFMRIMIIPPFILMLCSCHAIFTSYSVGGTFPVSMMCLPFMFMSIYMFLILVGPGKISFDYFDSLYLISRHHSGREEDLEEV